MRRLAILLLLLFLLPRAAPAQSLGPTQSITVIDSGTACINRAGGVREFRSDVTRWPSGSPCPGRGPGR